MEKLEHLFFMMNEMFLLKQRIFLELFFRLPFRTDGTLVSLRDMLNKGFSKIYFQNMRMLHTFLSNPFKEK